MAPDITLRAAGVDDAACLGVLATQVFLDTYATQGIRSAIAREVLSAFSTATMHALIEAPSTALCVAERAGHLIGFAQWSLGTPQALVQTPRPAELDRLYVQEPFTRAGVGSALLRQAEAAAAHSGCTALWLSPWVHNARALAFYARHGYTDLGLTTFVMDGEAIDNRVLVKLLP
jgi:diamine N-acetyltransferase